jgi:hypothetical protein
MSQEVSPIGADFSTEAPPQRERSVAATKPAVHSHSVPVAVGVSVRSATSERNTLVCAAVTMFHAMPCAVPHSRNGQVSKY